MSDILRDSTVGQLIRLFTGNKYLHYSEEKPSFRCPPKYLVFNASRGDSKSTTALSRDREQGIRYHAVESDRIATAQTAARNESNSSPVPRPLEEANVSKFSHNTSPTNIQGAYQSAIGQDSQKYDGNQTQSTTAPGSKVLVDWYSADDPENPQNWSRGKRALVVCLIYVYSLAVYTGSAIITPAGPYIEEQMGVSSNVASLSLSMYVLGYGVGPLLFSPLSEIPILGRNPPYMVSMGLFVIISIPTAVVNNFPALVVLRFLQGFMGSPCLATGGATLGDMFSMIKLPYFLAGWAGFATTGPALGPIISGFSIPAETWHWSMWEIVWFAAPVYVAMLILLPETSPSTILLRRAVRLRKLTGNNNIVSLSEIDQHDLSFHQVVVDSLWRPTQINSLDPAVMFTSIYSGLLYGVFYSFFEVFPLVYAGGAPGTETQGYGMNAGQLGLIFLSNVVGVVLGVICYSTYLYFIVEPEILSQGLGEPERRLLPALPASFLFPIGLFIFAWTGYNSPQIHWIVPTIGVVISTFGTCFHILKAPALICPFLGSYILFQCLLYYLPLNYPQYAASLFAANDFARSSIAAGAIHFSRPLFHNLGVGRGVSLLAGLTVGGVLGIFILWHYGSALRSRSKFTAKQTRGFPLKWLD